MKHKIIMSETGGALTGEARHRHEKREAAVMALMDLAPQEAAAIACTVLDEVAAGDPPYDALGDIRAAAEWWAGFANPAELQCYFASAVKRLENQALGIKARKRMFAALWISFSDADRKAFLARVDADGTFHGKDTA